MAAAVLSARAAEIYPKQLSVTSSGTSPAHYGEGAHPLSEKVWQQAGYRYEHRARGFNSQIFQEADLILAMDFDNHENILKRAERSDSRSKVMMLRSFDKTATSLEIPDPWGLGIASYQEVLEMVEASVSGLLQRLSDDTI